MTNPEGRLTSVWSHGGGYNGVLAEGSRFRLAQKGAVGSKHLII